MNRRAVVEALDSRRLFASIGGFVWTETDADGIYEAGESLLKDKTVFIDTNRNGKMDASEPRKITDAQGKYRFDNLVAGTYRVGREKQNGYWFSSPLTGYHDIVLGSVNVTNANIGTANRAPNTTPPTPPPTSPTDPTPTGATLQAETAALSGGTSKQTSHAGYTGTGFADFGGQGSAMQFTLQRTSAEVVNLQFRYANGSTGNRPLQVLVNGVAAGTLNFGPTGAWTNWVTTTLSNVSLPAGAVTIRVVASTTAGGANVDAMTLAATSGPVDPPPVDPPPTTPTGTLSWATASSMPQGKAEAFGGAIGGKLYVFGGYIDNTFKPTTSAHVYDPATNTWSAIASLPTGVSHAATAFDARYMYYAGGYPATATAQGFATSKAYRYDSVTNTYAALPDLPSARGAVAGAIVNGVFYVVGGCDSARNDRAEMFALDLNNLAAGWVQKASLPAARNHEAALALNGFVHVFGGDTGHDDEAVKNATHWRYDPTTDSWQTLAPLPTGRSHITNSVLVANGAILSVGGEGDNEAKLSRVDRYDPDTNTWSSLTALPSPRFSGVADFINGKIYFASGYNSTFEKTTYIGTFV